MTDKNRESKIIAAVACPTCHAPVGQPCRVLRGRPMVCSARKQAWQEQRGKKPVDYLFARQDRDYMLIAPQSADALKALRELAPRHEWLGGALRVPHQDMPALTRRLIAGGWRTGDQI